ncbi:MAG: replicative DNA helicase [Gammaproteobacteria bacterium]|nr:replicative DNA helicase [Gammaproteobacteria bacterium]|tara:strand:- start:3077 stop:4483 length:1407 start_codon:yes stop_codon:yes gene_type:complete
MSQNYAPKEELPFSVEAERAVLGGIMLKNDAWDLVSNLILEEDFYQEEHKLIFKTIKDLQDLGKPIDLITVQETIEGNGNLPELINLGGKNYLTQLAKETPSVANIESYAEIIKQRSNLRRLINTVDKISEVARESDSSSSDQVLDNAEEQILSLRDDVKRSQGPRNVKEWLGDVYSEIQIANESGSSLVGISTGFKVIDELTLGFQKSDLIIIAGRPSMGKTALALNIAENVAEETNKTVLVFSMEMAAEQVIRRFISSIAKIDLQRLVRGELDDPDFEGVDKAMTLLSSRNILLDDTPALTPAELRSRSRRIMRENKDLAMIVVDYIGLMQVPGRSDNRVAEISEISRSLKALAKELNIPVVALSQLNRAVDSRPKKQPILSDLRDSGALEQDADVIAFLYRHEYYDESDLESKGKALINIAKQRNGPTGTKTLAFRAEIARFENLAMNDDYIPPQFYEDRGDYSE